MIFGDCPHCQGAVVIGVPDGVKLPLFSRETCDNCGKLFWERISRINPMAYTDDEVVVDEESKTVGLKPGVI